MEAQTGGTATTEVTQGTQAQTQSGVGSLLGQTGDGKSSVQSTQTNSSNQSAATDTGGYEATDWRSSLPQEIRGEDSLKNMLSIETLARSYVHAQKMVGAEKIPIPGKHASESDWQQFYQKVGLPESVDKYEVNKPKDAKYVDDSLVNDLKPVAHKLGILPKQLNEVLNWYEERSGKLTQAQEANQNASFNQELKGLQTEWGKAYESRLSLANRTLEEIGGPELSAYVSESGLGNNVKLVKLLGLVGEKLFREDGVPKDGTGGIPTVFDPATAREKATQITMDASHPYHNPEHPKHKEALKEVEGLFSMAYPTQT